jgi:prephenate dehydratase
MVIAGISTLGPTGTCSEQAAQYFMQVSKLSGDVQLHSSFEGALETLYNKQATHAIVPSAYKQFHELVFNYHPDIQITGTFLMPTPELVIAGLVEPDYSVVACHPSPRPMLERLFPDATVVEAKSNSQAITNSGVGIRNVPVI